MAVGVRSKDTPHTFWVSSTDPRPTPGNKALSVGVRLIEYDTQRQYLWTGHDWVEDVTLEHKIEGVLKEIRDELKKVSALTDILMDEL